MADEKDQKDKQKKKGKPEPPPPARPLKEKWARVMEAPTHK